MKKKYNVVRVLDPESVSGFSKHQKEHYARLGYQPCLLADDTIKWLTEAQMAYRQSKGCGSGFFRRIFCRKPKPKLRRRRRSGFWRTFFGEQWGFLALLALITIAIFFLWTNWHVIF